MTNNDDVIDSRDVIERIEELDAIREAQKDADQALSEDPDNEELQQELDMATEDYEEIQEELEALEALEEEASLSPDWRYGETLIRESYFKEYAQQLAEDIGAIDKNAGWPNTCIDWDQAASELEADYFHVDFGGVAYLIRS